MGRKEKWEISCSRNKNICRLLVPITILQQKYWEMQHLLCTGPYFIPNVKVDSYAVFTNNMPAGAFRGFGGPQAAFEAESQINKLANLLHIDPVEID